MIKKSLLDPDYHKVVLILHSQGAIEGGLIIDWLLDELPQETLRNLEVYTFGNAANHFNNPHRSLSHFVRSLLPPRQARHAERDSRCIPHIEHYANSDDYVCLTGVLNFARIPNRYMGRLFVRPGSGHQFNQHYLDTMFTMGRDRRVLGHNNFMDSPVTKENCPEDDGILRECFSNVGRTCRAVFDGDHCLGDKSNAHPQKLIRVKDLSRLWWYRNGGSPLA